MGGGYDTTAHIPAEFDQCNGQGCTLCRVSTGTQLVKENQCTVITLSHNIHDSTHMTGERRQALGDRLLIANVSQNGIKGRQAAAVTGWHMKTALCHQCQKAHRFQSHGLSAGIGASDDHGVEVSAQPQGNGHNLLLVDQRMTGIMQLYPALVIHERLPGTHAISQFCFGEDHIQPHQHSKVQIDIVPMGCGGIGEFCQNPLDFFLLFDFQFTQGIVGVDGGHGLHEIGRTGGGHIMHKTGHIVLALALHRHHITALADGDDGFPEELGVSRRRNDLLQAVPNLAGLDPHVAADIRKFRTCVVSDLFLRKDRTENPVFQIFVGSQRLKKRIDDCLFFVFRDVTLDGSGAAQHCSNPQQLLGLQTAAQICPFQRSGHIMDISKIRITLPGAQIRCGGGFCQ